MIPHMTLSSDRVRDALARNDRYVHEVVEQLAVCPYARPARLAGRTSRYVLDTGPCGELEAKDLHLDVLRAMASDDGPEVVQWIYPTAPHDASSWDRAGKVFTQRCHDACGQTVVGVAPLHPEAAYLPHTAAAMVPLFRRAPDPTLQWISLRALDAVRSTRPRGEVLLPRDPIAARALLAELARPSLAETIADNNRSTALEIGLEAFEALLAGLR